MPTWNELFRAEQNIERAAEPEVYRFALSLEKLFAERPLHIWDVGCGAGGQETAIKTGIGKLCNCFYDQWVLRRGIIGY